jgi:hypothetical protein
VSPWLGELLTPLRSAFDFLIGDSSMPRQRGEHGAVNGPLKSHCNVIGEVSTLPIVAA